MTILCIFLVNKQALTQENGNLSCHTEPQAYAVKESIISCIYLAYQLFVAYMLRKTTLERFCEQDKSKKQQTQIENLFDNQPDGVLILSQSDDAQI